MDRITHEVRLSNWKAVIEQCQSRPKGQTIVFVAKYKCRKLQSKNVGCCNPKM